MSDFEKALILILSANFIQFVVGYFANRGRRNDSQIDACVTKIAVIEKDLDLLRKDFEKRNEEKK